MSSTITLDEAQEVPASDFDALVQHVQQAGQKLPAVSVGYTPNAWAFMDNLIEAATKAEAASDYVNMQVAYKPVTQNSQSPAWKLAMQQLTSYQSQMYQTWIADSPSAQTKEPSQVEFSETDVWAYLQTLAHHDVVGVTGDTADCLIARAFKYKYSDLKVSVSCFNISYSDDGLYNLGRIQLAPRVSNLITVFDHLSGQSRVPIKKYEFERAWAMEYHR